MTKQSVNIVQGDTIIIIIIIIMKSYTKYTNEKYVKNKKENIINVNDFISENACVVYSQTDKLFIIELACSIKLCPKLP